MEEESLPNASVILYQTTQVHILPRQQYWVTSEPPGTYCSM
jgi:hypothetical protein